MSDTIIRLERVCRVFTTKEIETCALTGISLEIHKGEFVSIAGPSGCGKSTLLSIMGLLDQATEGSYYLMNQDVSDLTRTRRARCRNRYVGFIFQSFNLIGNLTVAENVELPLHYQGVRGRERRERVDAILERVGMAGRKRHFPAQLSGGQHQRAAVARALVTKPSILLADEPTGNLDSKNSESVMSLFAELNREGATICMVTHDERYSTVARRTIRLFDGRIIEEETLPEAVSC